MPGCDVQGQTFEQILQQQLGRWNYCPFWMFRKKNMSPVETKFILNLLGIWHAYGRPLWFYVSHRKLRDETGLADATLVRVKRSLSRRGLIDLQTVSRRQATRYHISQDFLYTLYQHEKNSLLNTSTSSLFSDLKHSESASVSKVKHSVEGLDGASLTADADGKKYLPSRRFRDIPHGE